jgi:hypothetical protein
MMQGLLKKRFRFEGHDEMRPFRIYDLIVDRHGAKLKHSEHGRVPGQESRILDGRMQEVLTAYMQEVLTAYTMPMLAGWLSVRLGTRVRFDAFGRHIRSRPRVHVANSWSWARLKRAWDRRGQAAGMQLAAPGGESVGVRCRNTGPNEGTNLARYRWFHGSRDGRIGDRDGTGGQNECANGVAHKSPFVVPQSGVETSRPS